jgi:hypothetical protein
MTKFIVVIAWLFCSFIDYGLFLGSFTHEFPDQLHTKAAITWSLIFGPFGLPIVAVMGNGHWRVKPLTPEERWQAFHERWPILDRKYFNENEN